MVMGSGYSQRSQIVHGAVEFAFGIVHLDELNCVISPAAFLFNLLNFRDVGFQTSEVGIGIVSFALQKAVLSLVQGSSVGSGSEWYVLLQPRNAWFSACELMTHHQTQ